VTYQFSNDVDYEPEDDEPEETPRRGRWFSAVIVVGLAVVGSGSAFLWRGYGFESPIVQSMITTPSSQVATESAVTLKDFQALQQQLAGQMQQATQLMGAQQAEIKRLSDQVAALAAKLDALQHSVTSSQIPPTAPIPKPVVAPARKKSAAPKPAEASPAGVPPPPIQLTR
jgi:uncharacterized coiled-coil protein SlyX